MQKELVFIICTAFFVSSFLYCLLVSYLRSLHRGIKCDVTFAEHYITISYGMSQALLHGH